MAKIDEVISEIEKIEAQDVQFGSKLTEQFFLNFAKNINALCDIMQNVKCDFVPFGTTSWTSPAEVCAVVTIGWSGAGGGGGTTGQQSATLIKGSNGSSGQNTTFNGDVVAQGGKGGIGYTHQDSGGNSTFLGFEAQCNINNYTIKSRKTSTGGTGAYLGTNGSPIGDSSHRRAGGAGFGGENGRIGIRVFTGLPASTAIPLVIGSGGAAGANHPSAAGYAAGIPISLTNATAGQDSPGMYVICLGL